jgi:hypothetical protein
MLGNREIQKFGYKPMPGITSATIETQGRLGSSKRLLHLILNVGIKIN